MKLVIKVTANDIKKGQPDTVDLCPIALAILKCGFNSPWVADDEISFYTKSKTRITITTPKKMAKFINDFDDQKPVKPVTFVL